MSSVAPNTNSIQRGETQCIPGAMASHLLCACLGYHVMSHSLNSLKGVVEGFIWGITIADIRGDPRSLEYDYSTIYYLWYSI